ncbi:MAG: beta-propeller domain-containing protein [Candidatus Woesearchaeota archaeon]
MTQTKSKKIIFAGSIILLFLLSFISGCDQIPVDVPDFTPTGDVELKTFSSCSALDNALEEAREARGKAYEESATVGIAQADMAAGEGAASEGFSAPSTDYSQTNVQVQGVDEADIVKTDGKYIYTLSQNSLVIAKAYPEQSAKIESQTTLEKFSPQEMFIQGNRLLIFGRSSYEIPSPYPSRYPYSISTMSVKVFDISDKSDPEIVRDLDFEGNYVSSRKIDSWVYFISNNYPRYYAEPVEITDVLPKFRNNELSEDFEPMAGCADVRYFEPIVPENFLTIAAINMEKDQSEINKEVILGSGQNVYASKQNLYVAQSAYPHFRMMRVMDPEEVYQEKTNIHKFSLNRGKITYQGNGQVSGSILNQFSMDEYQDNFRIATTIGNVFSQEQKSTNNVYILDEDLDLIGSLEDLAPGERIYSTRFMGKRGYMVTFKKVDPLFVIDLSNPRNPRVLGKLKIPGFSDYLHPYDENHIIGVGKDTVEATEEQIGSRNLDFAWYQGVKLAIFDVSDVENPIQMHVELIGDRGTDSEVLRNHKAFLFDRNKNLLVLPITLAEIPEGVQNQQGNTYGDYVFQGAYVYNINLNNGFSLKGRITHFDDDEIFQKSGYYFRSSNYAVKRALYINNILYTISNGKIKLNYLNNLEEIKELDIELFEEDYYPAYY